MVQLRLASRKNHVKTEALSEKRARDESVLRDRQLTLKIMVKRQHGYESNVVRNSFRGNKAAINQNRLEYSALLHRRYQCLELRKQSGTLFCSLKPSESLADFPEGAIVNAR